MLAARASVTRNARRIARSFATAVDTTSVKVAAVDYKQPTSTVTLLVKAGSRYQQKEGVAHALKNFAFKSTTKRSALGTVRESELYGGILSASQTREHLALTAEFLRGDESFFIDLLSSFITSAKFTRHEFEEYVSPLITSDSEAAVSDPTTRAIEAAHALAFRTGLGSSLFAPSHHNITVEDIKAFASETFTKENMAVYGTGIDQALLTKLVEQTLGSAPSAAASSSPASSYFGGETRLDADSGPQTVFVGYGLVGGPSVEASVLASHLSTTPSVKWSQGLSPLVRSLPQGTSVQSIYLPYSDATLFGLLVQGSTAAGVKEAGKVAVQALKAAAGTINSEDLKKAVAKAKFAAASASEKRDGLISAFGSKIFAETPSLDGTLASLDKVDASGFSKATSALIGAKPTYVAVGDAHALPYADELGL